MTFCCQDRAVLSCAYPGPETTPAAPWVDPSKLQGSEPGPGPHTLPGLSCSSFSRLLVWPPVLATVTYAWLWSESVCFCIGVPRLWSGKPRLTSFLLFPNLPQRLLRLQLGGRVLLPRAACLPACPLLPVTEFLVVVCTSGAGLFWSVKRLLVPFTWAGAHGDSPLVWDSASLPLGSGDVWGWTLPCWEVYPVYCAPHPASAHSPLSLAPSPQLRAPALGRGRGPVAIALQLSSVSVTPDT